MNVEELLVYGKSYIHSDHAKLLLADLLNLNPLELLNHLEDNVEISLCEKYKREVEAVKSNIPLQYVIGSVNFYGNNFVVDNRVLIPRFETEELVENTIKYIEKNFKNEDVNILDLCCGSGVIGLTLKQKLPFCSVDLSDISKDALDVASINANNLNLDVNLIEGDLFSNINSKYNVIISNPPYIAENEEIEQIVYDNEPHIALYGGQDGLDYYRKIISKIKNYLKEDFLVAFEIGYQQKDAIINIIKSEMSNVNIEVKKDLSMRNRMIFIKSVNKI